MSRIRKRFYVLDRDSKRFQSRRAKNRPTQTNQTASSQSPISQVSIATDRIDCAAEDTFLEWTDDVPTQITLSVFSLPGPRLPLLKSVLVSAAALIRTTPGAMTEAHHGNVLLFGLKDICHNKIEESEVHIVCFGVVDFAEESRLISSCSCKTDIPSTFLRHSKIAASFGSFGLCEVSMVASCFHKQLIATVVSDCWSQEEQVQFLKMRALRKRATCSSLPYLRFPDFFVSRTVNHYKTQLPVFAVFTRNDSFVVPSIVDANKRLRCLLCSRSQGKYCSHTNDVKDMLITEQVYPAKSSRFQIVNGTPLWKSISKGSIGMCHTIILKPVYAVGVPIDTAFSKLCPLTRSY